MPRTGRKIIGWFEGLIDPFARAAGDPPLGAWAFTLHFLSRMRWPFVVLMATSLGVAVTEALMFVFVGQLIDILAAADRATFWADHGWTLVLMALVAFVLRPLFIFLKALLNEQTLTPHMPAMVRWQSHRHLLRQSLPFFQDDFAGRIATKVMQTGNSVLDVIETVADSVWYILVFAASSFFILADVDARLALPLTVWIVGYLLVARRHIPRMRARSKAMAEARSVLNGRIVDSYSNIQLVKLFAGARHEDDVARQAFVNLIGRVRNLSRLVMTTQVSLSLLNTGLIAATAALAVWLWWGASISEGAIAVSIGLVMRISNISGWIMFQMSSLFRSLGVIQDGVGTISQPIGLRDRPDARPLTVREGEVRFDKVRFGYHSGDVVIRDLSLDVAPGEKVGLVGRSGAGKTTLVNLLLRLFELEGGRILIDGQDVAAVTQESLRRAIGVVTQDAALLHRSIRENIAYGRPGAEDAAIAEAAAKSEAMEFIAGLRDPKGREGFDAHTGERGVKLSGGQRQRIAIARTILKDAPILVLDEATSALDSDAEAAIQTHLRALMADKTVIAIAHRLSTIAALDRLVVMDEGRIVETGSHAELVAAGGLYAQLWARQSGGFLATELEGRGQAA